MIKKMENYFIMLFSRKTVFFRKNSVFININGPAACANSLLKLS